MVESPWTGDERQPFAPAYGKARLAWEALSANQFTYTIEFDTRSIVPRDWRVRWVTYQVVPWIVQDRRS